MGGSRKHGGSEGVMGPRRDAPHNNTGVGSSISQPTSSGGGHFDLAP